MGSPVPVQSKPRWKRERSVRSVLAACETTSGRIPARRSARTWRTPEPFGAHSHLCPLPVQYAASRAVQVDRQHPRRVRPVHERVDAPPVQLADQRGHGHHEGRRRRHVADHRQARARRHRLEERLHDLGRIPDRERHPDDDDGRPVSLRGRPEGVERGVVLVVAGEELVAGAEAPRRQDRGHAGGGVGDERQARPGPRPGRRRRRCGRRRGGPRARGPGSAPARVPGGRARRAGPRGRAPGTPRTTHG